jgi:hypothetical protein
MKIVICVLCACLVSVGFSLIWSAALSNSDLAIIMSFITAIPLGVIGLLLGLAWQEKT